MRLLATLMTSITLVTTALFAYALATAEREPAPQQVARIASR
jgi:hypothetical protein